MSVLFVFFFSLNLKLNYTLMRVLHIKQVTSFQQRSENYSQPKITGKF